MVQSVKKGLPEELVFKLGLRKDCDRARWETKCLRRERGIPSSSEPQQVAGCALQPSGASRRGGEESRGKACCGYSHSRRNCSWAACVLSTGLRSDGHDGVDRVLMFSLFFFLLSFSIFSCMNVILLWYTCVCVSYILYII